MSFHPMATGPLFSLAPQSEGGQKVMDGKILLSSIPTGGRSWPPPAACRPTFQAWTFFSVRNTTFIEGGGEGAENTDPSL